jgi:hypothetical protein
MVSTIQTELITEKYSKMKDVFEIIKAEYYEDCANNVEKYLPGLKAKNVLYRENDLRNYHVMPLFTYKGKTFEISMEHSLNNISNFDDDLFGTNTKTVIILYYGNENILLYSDRNHNGYNLFSDNMYKLYDDINEVIMYYQAQTKKQELFKDREHYGILLNNFGKYLMNETDDESKKFSIDDIEKLLLQLFIHIHVFMCNGKNYFEGITLDEFISNY